MFPIPLSTPTKFAFPSLPLLKPNLVKILCYIILFFFVEKDISYFLILVPKSLSFPINLFFAKLYLSFNKISIYLVLSDNLKVAVITKTLFINTKLGILDCKKKIILCSHNVLSEYLYFPNHNKCLIVT